MHHKDEKLVISCHEAIVAFDKLNKDEYLEIRDKLNWCLGSYSYDHNPKGLIEYGAMSLSMLKAIKARHPTKVNKKVIEHLEEAIINV